MQTEIRISTRYLLVAEDIVKTILSAILGHVSVSLLSRMLFNIESSEDRSFVAALCSTYQAMPSADTAVSAQYQSHLVVFSDAQDRQWTPRTSTGRKGD